MGVRPQGVALHDVVYLTNYYLKFYQNGLISDILAPRATVTKRSDKYKIWDNEHFRHYQTIRAPKTLSNRFSASWSSDTFFCEYYALHDFISDDDRAEADAALDPEFDLVDNIGAALALDREKRVAALATASASIAAANKQTLADAARWDNFDGGVAAPESDPFKHVRIAKGQIHAATGMRPNALIVPYEKAMILAHHPLVLSRYPVSKDNVSEAGLPAVFAGLWVVEPGSRENTAKRGAADSMTSVWDQTKVYVAHIDGLPPIAASATMQGTDMPRSSGNKPTWLRTFDRGRTVRTWRDESRQGVDAYEPEECVDEKVVSTLLGASIANVFAA